MFLFILLPCFCLLIFVIVFVFAWDCLFIALTALTQIFLPFHTLISFLFYINIVCFCFSINTFLRTRCSLLLLLLFYFLCKAGLATAVLSFYMSEEVFFSLSYLSVNCRGHNICDWQFFPFNTFSLLFCSLLTSRVLAEKSHVVWPYVASFISHFLFSNSLFLLLLLFVCPWLW